MNIMSRISWRNLTKEWRTYKQNEDTLHEHIYDILNYQGKVWSMLTNPKDHPNPATNQLLVIGRTLWCLMGNPAGYRANHHPPQCLQSSVGQKSKHCLPHIWHWLPTTRLKPKNGQKTSKSKKVKSQKVFTTVSELFQKLKDWIFGMELDVSK